MPRFHKDEEETQVKSKIIRTDNWLNPTKTGKGFICFVETPMPKGFIIVGSMKALEEFVEGKRTGVNLGTFEESKE